MLAGFYFLTSLRAPVAGSFLGRLSDRRQDRHAIYRLCTTVGGIGWFLMAAATRPWMPFVIGALALSVAGAAGAQLYAAARDVLGRHPTPAENQVMAALRMGWSGGWVVGPVALICLGRSRGLLGR